MINARYKLCVIALLAIMFACGYWVGQNVRTESKVIGNFESHVPTRENKVLWPDQSEDYIPGEMAGKMTEEMATARFRTDI